MLLDLPPDDVLYEALLARDPAYEGLAFAGVTTTGVFCRLTCPARKPKREHTMFFADVAACLEAGFRPCLRCRPLDRPGADPTVARLLEALEQDPDRRWAESDVVAAGLDPSTVRRAFKRSFGISFLDMARLRRLGRAAERLSSGARVVEAQVEAGFESDSGFRAAFTRLLGRSPKAARGAKMLSADWIESPVGRLVAVADAETLHLVAFFDGASVERDLRRLQDAHGVGVGRTAPIAQLADELAAYFEGRAAAFATPLASDGSAFMREAWTALRAVPAGETRSYADLAAAIGRPSAVRAVARANALNPWVIVVPCHRIIGADGSLTGYGGGLWRKRWLLAHERRIWGPGRRTAEGAKP
jgi:AraC family transcriptional regulator of adaptative response/methylated-DNA-[protein]-cysteine methyltransferase